MPNYFRRGNDPVGASSLSAMSDIDLTTPPTDGQVLVWNAVKGKWVPGTASGGAPSSKITVTGKASQNAAASNSVTPPAGAAVGDYMFVHVGRVSTAAVSALSAGLTSLATSSGGEFYGNGIDLLGIRLANLNPVTFSLSGTDNASITAITLAGMVDPPAPVITTGYLFAKHTTVDFGEAVIPSGGRRFGFVSATSDVAMDLAWATPYTQVQDHQIGLFRTEVAAALTGAAAVHTFAGGVNFSACSVVLSPSP